MQASLHKIRMAKVLMRVLFGSLITLYFVGYDFYGSIVEGIIQAYRLHNFRMAEFLLGVEFYITGQCTPNTRME